MSSYLQKQAKIGDVKLRYIFFQFALALLAATDCSPISASVDVDARGKWKHKVSQRSKIVVSYFVLGWLVGKRRLVR